MRDRSITPTNLLDWPGCAGLLPDQKLILLWLWGSPFLSCAGAGLVPINPAAATLGLSPSALTGGLQTLRDTGLISLDEKTGEVFIKDWFRFHTFKSKASIAMLDSAIKKIVSPIVKRLVTMAANRPTAEDIHSASKVINKPKLLKKSSNDEKPIKSTICAPTTTSTPTFIFKTIQDDFDGLGSLLCKQGVKSEQAIQVLIHATEHQQNLLLKALKNPPKSFKKDSASWAAGLCQLALNEQLQA